ncbi:MAG TPA: hypothetical protein VH369_15995 [Bryobacteraceae bacterium]
MIYSAMGFKRSASRFFSSTFLLSAAGALSLAADRTITHEEYAVYSAALANIWLSHADTGEALAILRDTIDPHELPVPTQGCSSLPVEFRRRVQDVLATDRVSSAADRKTLKNNKLVIGRRYILLTPQQADVWRQQRFNPKMRTDPPAPKLADPFAGTSDLIQISGVLFNAKKSVALVYLSATCGLLCMSSQWYLLEKIKGVWRVLPTPACGRIS